MGRPTCSSHFCTPPIERSTHCRFLPMLQQALAVVPDHSATGRKKPGFVKRLNSVRFSPIQFQIVEGFLPQPIALGSARFFTGSVSSPRASIDSVVAVPLPKQSISRATGCHPTDVLVLNRFPNDCSQTRE